MTEQQILNRPLKRAWLDAALRAARLTQSAEHRQTILDEVLFDEGLGETAIKKTTRVLKNIWWEPPKHSVDLIKWAREFNKPVDTRVLHLGAMLGSYPFLGTIYGAIGMIARQTDLIGNADVKSRVISKWGDRESVQRAVLMALNTLKSLEILRGEPNSTRKHLQQPIPVPTELVPWLTHALLLTRSSNSIDKSLVSSAPELFGIQIGILETEASYPFLEAFAEGGGRSVVEIRPSYRT